VALGQSISCNDRINEALMDDVLNNKCVLYNKVYFYDSLDQPENYRIFMILRGTK
jgi:hypothetical protein